MNQPFYIEVDCQQKNHDGERICGDVFVTSKIKEENRIIAVLSDGMGHGIKANILATLTATMAKNFTKEHKDAEKISEIIMNTLPVCSVRKMSYATFTIVDVENDGYTTIIEYDNPKCLILRNNKIFEPNWKCIILNSEKNKGKEILTCSFYPEKEDRLLFWSDGVAQSGLGTPGHPFGWGRDNMVEFCERIVQNQPDISGRQIATKVINMAFKNDAYKAKDDISCGSIYFREPRKLLVCTGPPFEEENDKTLAESITDFEGKIILCGATTTDIVARELEREVEDSFVFEDPDLPPESYMDGIDLITEGILTLGKVTEILKQYDNSTNLGKGPADKIVKMFLDSDEINFIIGTKINIAHQDPNLPVELEIRRTVVKRIASILEDKFLKEVHLTFI